MPSKNVFLRTYSTLSGKAALALGTLLLLFLPSDRPYACLDFGDEGDEYRFFFFRPELVGQADLYPFLYTAHLYFGYPYPWDDLRTYAHTALGDRDEQALITGWLTEIGDARVRPADAYGVLFNTAPDSLLRVRENPGPAFASNTFVEALRRPGREPLWQYLLDAKEGEAYNNFVAGWDADSLLEARAAGAKRLYSRVRTRLENGNLSPFLQARYAFLALKLVFYGNFADGETEIRTYYQRFLEPLPETDVLRTLALHYVRQTVRDSFEATYLRSLVFDRSSSKKLISHRVEPEWVPGALRFTRNAHEQAVLHTLRGLNDPGKVLADVKAVLALEPHSAYARLLVCREINKLEDWIFTPDYLGQGSSLHHAGSDWGYGYADFTAQTTAWRARDLAYLRELRAALQTALDARGADPGADFLRLAIAHLYLLDRQPERMPPLLRDIRDTATAVTVQRRLLDFARLLQTTDVRQPTVQDSLAAHLDWLRAHRSQMLEGERTYTLCLAMAARAFDDVGERHVAALLRQQGDLREFFRGFTSAYYGQIQYLDRTGTTDDTRRAIAVLEKPRKSAFEKLLARPFDDVWPFYDLLGTQLLRESDVRGAAAAFAAVPDSFYHNTYEFATYLDDDPFRRVPGLESRPSFDVYDKKSIVARLIQLDSIATNTTGQPRAQALVELGNAWYNFSWYGNSWMMLSFSHSVQPTLPSLWHDWTLPRLGTPRNTLVDQFYRLQNAAAYFDQAAKTPGIQRETAARAAYMLAQVEYHRRTAEKESPGYVPRTGHAAAKFYYKNYRETAFYCDNPCPTIEAFK